jgi:hypothetical protein
MEYFRYSFFWAAVEATILAAFAGGLLYALLDYKMNRGNAPIGDEKPPASKWPLFLGAGVFAVFAIMGLIRSLPNHQRFLSLRIEKESILLHYKFKQISLRFDEIADMKWSAREVRVSPWRRFFRGSKNPSFTGGRDRDIVHSLAVIAQDGETYLSQEDLLGRLIREKERMLQRHPELPWKKTERQLSR